MPNTAHNPTLRVLRILESLAANPEGMILTELSNAVQSPKSTILPILKTMEQEGFVLYNPTTAKYKVGIKTYMTGTAYISNMNGLQFIRSQMRQLVQTCAETCQMGILDGNQVLYVAIEETDAPIRIASHVGKRLPVYCTALGKALCCQKDEQDLKQMFPQGLAAFTPKTITSISVLAQQLAQVKHTLVAFENEEILEGLCCISVPILRHGTIVAAVSVSMSPSRAMPQKRELVIRLLKDLQEKACAYLENPDVPLD